MSSSAQASKPQPPQRVVPGSEIVYTVTNGTHRINYLASLCLNHENISWNCFLGDVVAVAVSKTSKLPLELPQHWDPMSDKNWEPALVVGMAQIISKGKAPRFEVHTQPLRRAIHSKLAKKLKAVFDPKRKLPRVLLATMEFQVIDPTLILPAKIRFLNKDTFNGRGQAPSSDEPGVIFQSVDNLWEMNFHVPKLLDSAGNDSNENPDFWTAVGSLKGDNGAPAPLKRAWKTWDPTRNDSLLLQSLIKAFTVSLDLRRKQAKKMSNRRKEQILKQANQLAVAEKEKESRSVSRKTRRVDFQDSGLVRPLKKAFSSVQPVRSILKIGRLADMKVSGNANSTLKQVEKKAQAAKKRIAPKHIKPDSQRPFSSKRSSIAKALSKNNISNTRTSNKKQEVNDDDESSEITSTTSTEEVSLNVEALDDMITQVGKKEYYMRVEMDVDEGILDSEFASTDSKLRRRIVGVGSILPLSCEGASSFALDKTNPWFPFECPWAAAQIVSIYFDLALGEWTMEVRWFDRFADLTTAEQEVIMEKGYSLEKISSMIFERIPITTCSVDSILPGEIVLSTNTDGQYERLVIKSYESGLPQISFLCQQYFSKNGDCVNTSWATYDKSFGSMPSPLKRGIDGIRSKKAAAAYRQAIAGAMESSESNEAPAHCRSITCIQPASECLLEKWGLKFFDAVEIDTPRSILEESFQQTDDTYVLKVGIIVPVSNGNLSLKQKANPSETRPFRCGWHPAQIVSIYQQDQSWMAEVRWFYKFNDLQPQHQEDHRGMDRKHIIFETEHYEHIPINRILPGRIAVTSSSSIAGDDRWNAIRSFSGTPIVPRLCQFMCLDDEIDESKDWWNVDQKLSEIPDPLKRGLLLTPRNRLNKDRVMILARIYRKSIRSRVEENDLACFERWSLNHHVEIFQKNEVEFQPVYSARLRVGEIVHSSTSQKKDFSMSAEIPFHTKYLIKPPRALRKDKHASWTVNVGDSVCFANPSAKGQADHVILKHESSPWYPFLVRWSFAQVLSIYQNHGKNASQPLLELRLYCRESELCEFVNGCIPPCEDLNREEVFETSFVIDGVPATNLLAPTCAFLGQHQKSVAGTGKKSEGIPSVPFRCKYFFLSDAKRFQPLYCSSFTPEKWYARLLERGCSKISKYSNLEVLHQIIQAEFTLGKNSFDARELCFGTSIDDHLFEPHYLPPTPKKDQSMLISSVSCPPIWKNYACSDLFFPEDDRSPREKWRISLGDIVAAVSNTSVGVPSRPNNPFVVDWTPCQVLSIKAVTQGVDQHYIFRIRELALKAESARSNILGLPELVSSSDGEMREVQYESLVGPLTPVRDYELSDLDWETFVKYLPLAPVILLDRALCKNHFEESLQNVFAPSDSSMIMQWLQQTRNTATSKALLSPPPKKVSGSSILSSIKTFPASGVAPFRVDASTRRSYYSEVKLTPPLAKYSFLNRPAKIRPWALKMGDIVLVEYAGEKRFPMNTNWAVAQVICMWREFDSEEDLNASTGSLLPGLDNSSYSLKIEIRWFSRREDILSYSDDAASSSLFEEVFETDETEIVDASRLLSPAVLHDNPSKASASSGNLLVNGVPVPEFYCGKFWSIQRRSLIPCGGITGMTKRGRLYSKCLTNDMFPALPKSHFAENDNLLGTIHDTSWKKDFESVIKNLTLKNSSTSSYIQGEGLVGREQELAKIISFLRAAIRGDATTGDVKTSIFLAGPPGVGKTACVRSAISQLHQEQAQGLLPAFQFFSLNGMEMRHPVEAYVRFWEGLSGGKEIRSAERACSNLEEYYTSENHDGAESVSVVLLDEIDYLVTEKQTVLYNFFDWPKRAAELASGRRLVVIGISNTLNLAEQFLPSIQSRIGSERCCFKAYNLEDIILILKAKIREASPNNQVFEDDAILFASKKTAALCGDIRKAFQICRAAAELVMEDAKKGGNRSRLKNGRPVVRISDVQRGSRSSFNTALLTAVSMSTPYQALVLVTIASLSRSTGRESGGFDIQEILVKMESLCGSFGRALYMPPPSFGETMTLLNQLGEMNLVEMRTPKSTSSSFRSSTGGSGGAWPLVSIVVDDNTLLKAFRGTPHQILAEKFLSSF